MSELTPERIRDAAEVVRAATAHVCTQMGIESLTHAARILDGQAANIEREQAAEAKRKKRIDELSDEMIAIAYPDISFPRVSDMQRCKNIATVLIARYPALADGPES
ncbi:hypothetical protein [Mycolicibacterium sp.]|uniref:hypothetical protein n=1 Tax=Mycolicibacterium sp. TaxID=2320850 RepID=UPI0037C61A02